MTFHGLVLAAGGSKRLGRPKQLLPYGRATLLDHVLDTARSCSFDQLLCVIGGAAGDVRSTVDFDGVEVVENPDFGRAARRPSRLRCTPWIPLRGPRPHARRSTWRHGRHRGEAARRARRRADRRVRVLRRPRSSARVLALLFPELESLHGDKAVWKLLDRHAAVAAGVPVDGAIPRDVDTWEDYTQIAR